MLRIASIIFLYSISAAGNAQAESVTVKRTRNAIIIQSVPRELPFEFSVSSETPPKSLLEAAEQIYKALPENHLRLIASYIGYYHANRKVAQYPTELDFQNALYSKEILHKAWGDWGFLGGRDPLDAAVNCVGDRTLPKWMILEVGFMYIKDQARPGDRRNYRQVDGYRQAQLAAHRLFEVCDRSSSSK
ncbi:MAG: hypothetical protein ACJ8ER_11670 [Allosphingosinicella sp.]